MPKWEYMDRIARSMEERYEKNKLNLYTSQRYEIERDINQMKEMAREARQNYVNWLWGYG